MSITITKRVSKEKLPKILPRAYSGFSAPVDVAEPMTVVVFDDALVKSGTLRRALHRVKDVAGTSLLLVGYDFTQESRGIADTLGATLMTQTCSGWTDESHEKIRTLIATKVKKPDWS